MTEALDAADSGVVVGADGSEHGRRRPALGRRHGGRLRPAADRAAMPGPTPPGYPTLIDRTRPVCSGTRWRWPGPATRRRGPGTADARFAGAVAAGGRGERRSCWCSGRAASKGSAVCCWARPPCTSPPTPSAPWWWCTPGWRAGAVRGIRRRCPGNPGQVVLGYDGSPASNRAAAFAFRHAEAIGCGVVAVSVEPGRGEPETEEIDPENATPGSDTSAFHSPVIVTAAVVPRCPGVLRRAAPAARPRCCCPRRSGAALLVVGSRGHGWLRRTGHGLGQPEGAGPCRVPGRGAAPRHLAADDCGRPGIRPASGLRLGSVGSLDSDSDGDRGCAGGSSSPLGATASDLPSRGADAGPRCVDGHAGVVHGAEHRVGGRQHASRGRR